jgi:hypothetical protein
VVSGSKPSQKGEIPDEPAKSQSKASLTPTDSGLEYSSLRNTNEEKLTRLEEARQAEMEVAQEEDEAPQACAEDAQDLGVTLTSGGMG